ncbi:hypothetical protein Salat_1163600 [Sesamum alatum]|uniref:Uncharacterized protein n=1 Tax=Sesamum alatum TaxID=300844 RepID=A0AAE1YFJ3_9LAMI|nr:hypothetical protein Salat_1163600 [Sesamum alatum]
MSADNGHWSSEGSASAQKHSSPSSRQTSASSGGARVVIVGRSSGLTRQSTPRAKEVIPGLLKRLNQYEEAVEIAKHRESQIEDLKRKYCQLCCLAFFLWAPACCSCLLSVVVYKLFKKLELK